MVGQTAESAQCQPADDPDGVLGVMLRHTPAGRVPGARDPGLGLILEVLLGVGVDIAMSQRAQLAGSTT